MADLPTNFKDDILDTSVNTRRRYRMYENTDGTIELEDVTEYSQVGNEFGAGQINETNTEVNKKFDKNMLVRDLDTINAITKEGYAPDALALKEVSDSLQNENNESFNFGYLNGVRGFFTDPSRADDSFVPFNSCFSAIHLYDETLTSQPVYTFKAKNNELTIYTSVYGATASTIDVFVNNSKIKTLSNIGDRPYLFKNTISGLNIGDEIRLQLSNFNLGSGFPYFIFVI